MFLCALDVGRRWIRLVLTADYPESAPVFLEGKRFPRSVDPEQLFAQLDDWTERYGRSPELLVCNSSDRLPRPLFEALNKDELVWVDAEELRSAGEVWRSTRIDRQWRRGGLMAMLYGSPMVYSTEDDIPFKAAWDWVYAQLRRQLLEVASHLIAEGRILDDPAVCPHCLAAMSAEPCDEIPF